MSSLVLILGLTVNCCIDDLQERNCITKCILLQGDVHVCVPSAWIGWWSLKIVFGGRASELSPTTRFSQYPLHPSLIWTSKITWCPLLMFASVLISNVIIIFVDCASNTITVNDPIRLCFGFQLLQSLLRLHLVNLKQITGVKGEITPYISPFIEAYLNELCWYRKGILQIIGTGSCTVYNVKWGLYPGTCKLSEEGTS